MSQHPTPTTRAYRSAVASAAAGGPPLQPLAWMAFTDAPTTYDPEADTTLPGEFIRLPLQVQPHGPVVTCFAEITGTQAGLRAIRGAAVFTADGVLVGSRALAPKELETTTALEIEIDFEY